VCRRRRRYGRRRLCMLARAAGNGGVHVLLLRRRRWKDRRRACRVGRGAGVSPPASVWPAAALRVGGGGGQRRRVRATAPPPALARPAADVSGEERRGCVAAGVDMACGGTLRRGLRVRKGQSCDWPAAGIGETGGGRVERGRAQVCCRRCLYGRRWPLGGSGCRRRRYGRRRHCVLGVAGGQRWGLDCAFVVDVWCTELGKKNLRNGEKIPLARYRTKKIHLKNYRDSEWSSSPLDSSTAH